MLVASLPIESQHRDTKALAASTGSTSEEKESSMEICTSQFVGLGRSETKACGDGGESEEVSPTHASNVSHISPEPSPSSKQSLTSGKVDAQNEGQRVEPQLSLRLPRLLTRFSQCASASVHRPLPPGDDGLEIPIAPAPSKLTRSTSKSLVDEIFSTENVASRSSSASAHSSVTMFVAGFARRARRHLLISFDEPFNSNAACALSLILICSNLIALFLLCVEHMVSDTGLFDSSWGRATLVVNLIATLEAFLRAACAPRRRRSLGHMPNLVDGACVIPFWFFRVANLEIHFGMQSLVLFCRLELWLRFLKLSRYFNGWRLLFLAITEAGPALMLPLVALFLLMGFGACVILIAEEASQMSGETDDAVILGFPNALMFCLLCIIAIDSGPFYDLELKSQCARIVVGALMMSGLVVFAMPMSIVGTCFCRVWFQRDRLLFIDAVRRRVERETEQDTKNKLHELFDAFARNLNASLGFYEFRQFVTSIVPHMSAESLVNIFNSFDQDQNGSVSFQEVHAAVFPEDADFEFLIRSGAEDEADEEPMQSSDGCAQAWPSSEGGSEDVAARWMSILENRLRVIERRQHESSVVPPWCQIPTYINTPKMGTRRSSNSSTVRATPLPSIPHTPAVHSQLGSRRTSGASTTAEWRETRITPGSTTVLGWKDSHNCETIGERTPQPDTEVHVQNTKLKVPGDGGHENSKQKRSGSQIGSSVPMIQNALHSDPVGPGTLTPNLLPAIQSGLHSDPLGRSSKAKRNIDTAPAHPTRPMSSNQCGQTPSTRSSSHRRASCTSFGPQINMFPLEGAGSNSALTSLSRRRPSLKVKPSASATNYHNDGIAWASEDEISEIGEPAVPLRRPQPSTSR